MFVLVVITCMSFDNQTACQEFERPDAYNSESSCQRAASLEKGRYARRAARRPWLLYRWACRGDRQINTTPRPEHNRGRPRD